MPLSISNIIYRYFRLILTKAKLPRIRLYDLRHSGAPLLRIAEENQKGRRKVRAFNNRADARHLFSCAAHYATTGDGAA
jgi:hypothetical protein